MNSPKKHIVLLTPGFSESEEDSTTIPALQIFVKALLVNNPQYSLKIITFQFPFTSKKYNWFGAEILPLNGKNKRIKKLSIWKKATVLLQKINSEKKIDLIHSFWIGECAYIGQKFAKKHKIKHLITAMGQDVKANLWLNTLTKNVFKNSRFITLSKNHQRLLLKNYNLDSTIISWGIDTNNFPENQDKIIDILGVGSLNEVKNYSLFLNIIAALNIKDLKVEIIGEGNLETYLKRENKLHNLENVINFKGKLPRNEVLNKMAKAKILLHTSNYESFGLVFLEALNSQMKIVSFNVGFAENSENWKVCKTKKEMIDSIHNMLKNYTKPTAKNHHLINHTILKYCKIYNE